MSSVYPLRSNRTVFIHRKFRRQSNKSRSRHANSNRRNRKWREIEFPNRVKLIEQPNETLRFFNLANKYYRKGYNVNYNLSKIVQFTPESIAVFTAYIASDEFTNSMGSRGNVPRNPLISRLFKESGFFKHVNLIDGNLKNKPSSSIELLHKVTENKVETEIAKEACLYIMNKLNIKFIDDMETLYVILIEAMQNTNNHASAGTKLEYDWWLYRYEDKANKMIHFTFLDVGVGVFKSLPFISWKKSIMKRAGVISNLDLVDDLLAGKIKSRTLRKDRGKGIPQIFTASQDEMFKDFYILSNDVLINTKTKTNLKLNQEFSGTLYYWTINLNN